MYSTQTKSNQITKVKDTTIENELNMSENNPFIGSEELINKVGQLPPIIPIEISSKIKAKADDFKTFDFKSSSFLNISESDLKRRNEEEEKRKAMSPIELTVYLNSISENIPKYKGRYFQRDKKALHQKGVLSGKQNIFQLNKYEMRKKQEKIRELVDFIKREKKRKKNSRKNF